MALPEIVWVVFPFSLDRRGEGEGEERESKRGTGYVSGDLRGRPDACNVEPNPDRLQVLWPVWRALWVNPPFCLQWTMYAEGESTFTSSRGCRVDRSGQPEEDGVRAGEHVEVDEDLVNLHAEALFKLGPQQRLA